jgi:hypothetical protein
MATEPVGSRGRGGQGLMAIRLQPLAVGSQPVNSE